MTKQNIKSKQGFTIIEVVLVLAIAGLIFLMVFVALPALQRSQRDTQRRNDIARVNTALTNYQTNHSYSNNKTNLPGESLTALSEFIAATDLTAPDDKFATSCNANEACSFVRDYMNSGVSDTTKADTFEDPSGEYYNLVITPNVALNATGLAITTGNVTTTNSRGDSYTTSLETRGSGVSISSAEGSFDAHVIFIVPGGRCNGDIIELSSKNDYAVAYRLEGAGVYCVDNQ